MCYLRDELLFCLVAIILPTLTPAHFDLAEDTYMLILTARDESRVM